MKKQKGNFFLLPNCIFDEEMKPRDKFIEWINLQTEK